jgi:RecA/RadA recombinase
MGIRLQPDVSLTVKKVKESISEILGNPEYKKRANELSKISQTYQGHITACDLTVEFIKKNQATAVVAAAAGVLVTTTTTTTEKKQQFIKRFRTKATKTSDSIKTMFKYEKRQK